MRTPSPAYTPSTYYRIFLFSYLGKSHSVSACTNTDSWTLFPFCDANYTGAQQRANPFDALSMNNPLPKGLRRRANSAKSPRTKTLATPIDAELAFIGRSYQLTNKNNA